MNNGPEEEINKWHWCCREGDSRDTAQERRGSAIKCWSQVRKTKYPTKSDTLDSWNDRKGKRQRDKTADVVPEPCPALISEGFHDYAGFPPTPSEQIHKISPERASVSALLCVSIHDVFMFQLTVFGCLVRLHVCITFSHSADAFIQSHLQMRTINNQNQWKSNDM